MATPALSCASFCGVLAAIMPVVEFPLASNAWAAMAWNPLPVPGAVCWYCQAMTYWPVGLMATEGFPGEDTPIVAVIVLIATLPPCAIPDGLYLCA